MIISERVFFVHLKQTSRRNGVNVLVKTGRCFHTRYTQKHQAKKK